MSLSTSPERRISMLIDKGYKDELIAHIEGVDIGLVRSVRERRDHPTLSPTSSRNYFGRSEKGDKL